MALRLACSGSEAVDLEAAGDPDDAGLMFAGGEVAGFLGGSWAGPVGPIADEEGRVKDLEQEDGHGQVKVLRGKPAVTESVAAASACGKLIFSGGIPVASTAAPIRVWMAW